MGLREIAAGHDRIVRELNEERAAALVRISRVLESAIAQLHAARARIDSADGSARAHEIVRYGELHRLATTYRWYLEVQREALGLRRHHVLDEFYVIPGPVEPERP
jgi:hypothetical protein